MFKAAVLTASDSASRGEKIDESGPIISNLLIENGFDVVRYKIVPDEADEIKNAILEGIEEGLDLIITTGGTGLTPRDVTPDATEPLLQRKIPGIAEAIRARGLEETPRAMLSRGLAGVRDGCLIINLPGSPSAAKTGMECIIPVISHAIKKIKGDTTPCHKPQI